MDYLGVTLSNLVFKIHKFRLVILLEKDDFDSHIYGISEKCFLHICWEFVRVFPDWAVVGHFEGVTE